MMDNVDMLEAVWQAMLDNPEGAEDIAAFVAEGGMAEFAGQKEVEEKSMHQIPRVPRFAFKSMPSWSVKKRDSHAGEPCKPGLTQAATGCTPASKDPAKPKTNREHMADAATELGLNLSELNKNPNLTPEQWAKLRAAVGEDASWEHVAGLLNQAIRDAKEAKAKPATKPSREKPVASQKPKEEKKPTEERFPSDEEEDDEESVPDLEDVPSKWKERYEANPYQKPDQSVTPTRKKVGERIVKGVAKPIYEWQYNGKRLPRHLLNETAKKKGTGASIIPGNWENVQVNLNPDASWYATGTFVSKKTGKPRTKTLSNPKFDAFNADVKFERIMEAISKRKEMADEIARDIKKGGALGEIATLASLIFEQGFRPGSENTAEHLRGFVGKNNRPMSKADFRVERTPIKKIDPVTGKPMVRVAVSFPKFKDGSKSPIAFNNVKTQAALLDRVKSGELEDADFWFKSFGATTLEARHVVKKPDGVYLEFMGKEHVWNSHKVTDPDLAKELLQRKASLPHAGQLFKRNLANETTLRRYVGQLDGGGFLTKDLRTMAATRLAMEKVALLPAPKTAEEYDQRVMEVAEAVCAKLGNDAVQSLNSYIAPEVFTKWKIKSIWQHPKKKNPLGRKSLDGLEEEFLEDQIEDEAGDQEHGLPGDDCDVWYGDPAEPKRNWREVLSNDEEDDNDEWMPDEEHQKSLWEQFGFDYTAAFADVQKLRGNEVGVEVVDDDEQNNIPKPPRFPQFKSLSSFWLKKKLDVNVKELCRKGERSDLTGCEKADGTSENVDPHVHPNEANAHREKVRKRRYNIGRKLAEACKGCVHVLGMFEDTSKVKREKGKTVLLMDNWSVAMNDGWVDVIIEESRPVEFVKPIRRQDFIRKVENPETGEIEERVSILHREVGRLVDAGYTPVKDDDGNLISMTPPGRGQVSQKKLVRKTDKLGRPFCYDDAVGAFHRVPCIKPIAKPKSRVSKPAKTAAPPLSPKVKRIFKNLDSFAKTNTESLIRHFGLTEKHVQRCKEVFEQLEITVNFDPDMQTHPSMPGYTVIESLLQDGHLRNLFETLNGNGSTNLKARNSWEMNNFGTDVEKLKKNERPKYGMLNCEDRKLGETFYGSACFVLNKELLKDRITFTPKNSSITSMLEVGTYQNPLNAAIRNQPFLEAVKESGIDEDNAWEDAWDRAEYDYLETQIWGDLPLKGLVKEIRAHKRSKQLQRLADVLGVPLIVPKIGTR